MAALDHRQLLASAACIVLDHASASDMLYPAMPFVYYTKLTDADVDAIHAYLHTVAPVKNEVVADQLPFPMSIRLGMRARDAIYFREHRRRRERVVGSQAKVAPVDDFQPS